MRCGSSDCAERKLCNEGAPECAGQTSSTPVRRAYALVLGITDYQPAEDPGTEQDANVTTYDPLVCCVNDARFMRENLEEIGFQVEVAENLTGRGIKQKVATFVERHKRAARADGAHGAEVRTHS